METNLIYWKGVVDGFMATLHEDDINIDALEKEKDFGFRVEETGVGRYKVELNWLSHYNGDLETPEYQDQPIFFTDKTTVSKLNKDLYCELETIQKLPSPEDFVVEVRDYYQELKDAI